MSFPLSRTLRFRDSNLEAVSLINPPGDYDGVLADEKGEVLGAVVELCLRDRSANSSR